jgi:hypothetical protein
MNGFLRNRILSAVAMIGVVSCSGEGPTAPGESIPVPYFKWFGDPSPEQQLFGEAAWERNAACAGVDPKRIRELPVLIFDSIFWCGVPGHQVSAAGCIYFGGTQGLSIHVGRKYFYTAFPNELMHLAIFLRGGRVGYDNPLFWQCKWW